MRLFTLQSVRDAIASRSPEAYTQGVMVDGVSTRDLLQLPVVSISGGHPLLEIAHALSQQSGLSTVLEFIF